MRQIGILTTLFLINALGLAQDPWVNPIQKQGRLGSPLVETSPFVFQDKLYLLANNQYFWDVHGTKPGDFFDQDEVRIIDVASGDVLSIALRNHGFGTAFVWNDRVYVFGGNFGKDKPWRQITEITMTSSTDLKTWTKPKTILRAVGNEHIFNAAVCQGQDKFVLLYETNDSRWTPFTFKYLESDDLENWLEVPGALYGTDKYVGGPALYYEGGWYYTLYLQSLKPGYETRITRSRDLIRWEDAPIDRPFVTFDPSHFDLPLRNQTAREINASDVELCYFQGETILFFTGSDQQVAGDLQWARYEGTPKALFEHFYKKEQTLENPESYATWTLPSSVIENMEQVTAPLSSKINEQPTPQQLAYQERQLGAFIHFGPATYVESDMLSVPPAEIFNPTQLDAEQWVRTAQAFGAKHVVLTVKHHNGFCLWPTSTTNYSVENSPWKGGRGDVVKEFVEACRKYDLKIGFYVSGGDTHFGCSSTPDPLGQRQLVGNVHQYFPVFMEQLRELLTGYSDISYLWFDGAYDPFGWDVRDPETGQPLGTNYGDAIRGMVKHLQPNAVVMGGTQPDIRWAGSEQGMAPYPIWNVVELGDGAAKWVGPHNSGWIPAEANLHTRQSWFWRTESDNTLASVEKLKQAYLNSMGRGANLLINMTPDTSGLIGNLEVNRLVDFGKEISSAFSSPVGISSLQESKENQYHISLSESQNLNAVVIEEDLLSGQHVESYQVDALQAGKWETIAAGKSIGRKRIHVFDNCKTSRLRLTLQSGRAVIIRKFAAYLVNDWE